MPIFYRRLFGRVFALFIVVCSLLLLFRAGESFRIFRIKSMLDALCFAGLIFLACIDYFALWRARGGESEPNNWLSPFTLACQGAFAVFAAFHIGPRAFENFSSSDSIMYAELVFFVLMMVGFLIQKGR